MSIHIDDPATIQHNLNIALAYLSEKVLDINPKQALCLSSLKYIDRLTLCSINRDVNPVWVAEMKKSILDMKALERRTTLTVCIDIRDIQAALLDAEAAQDFKANIINGQHRYEAMKALKQEFPDLDYTFWLEVYIIHSEEETKKLLFDLDKRLDITPSDKKQIEIRKKFIDALSLLTGGFEKKRCILRSKNHPILRDIDVMRSLGQLSVEQIEGLIKKVSLYYKQDFTDANLNKNSVLYQVIHETKLYQLINWQSGSWIKKMLSL